mmetsp:Transcript_19280/g.34916  ORF Transcript_19280/g.34916 Transcript_19280/m.34916 type:complete len:131 (+) Transcript_19280:209-601(+)
MSRGGGYVATSESARCRRPMTYGDRHCLLSGLCRSCCGMLTTTQERRLMVGARCGLRRTLGSTGSGNGKRAAVGAVLRACLGGTARGAEGSGCVDFATRKENTSMTARGDIRKLRSRALNQSSKSSLARG